MLYKNDSGVHSKEKFSGVRTTNPTGTVHYNVCMSIMSNCYTTKLKVVPKRNGWNVVKRLLNVLWTVDRPVPFA